MAKNKVSLKEFWDRLSKHDWSYQFSDDNKAYKAGQAQREELAVLAQQGPRFQSMFNKFAACHAVSPNLPNPPRPK